MRAARNQIIERHYFERFRKAYSLPTGQVAYGDKPDVTLTGERTIGIEVTRFYLQPGSRLESKQRQRPLRDAVVERAQALYRAQGGKAVELHFSFDTPVAITPRRTGKLVRDWRFERIAERKLRRRQLTEDGNVEITGRDLREGSALAHQRSERGDTVLPGRAAERLGAAAALLTTGSSSARTSCFWWAG
jgi:hypothetical protein